MLDEVELFGWSAEPCERRGEPVTVGVPWPRGVLRDAEHLACIGPDVEVTLQTEVLERWPDGSVRWVLCDMLLSTNGNGATGYRLVVMPYPTPRPPLRSEGEAQAIWINFEDTEGQRQSFTIPDSVGEASVRVRTPFRFATKLGAIVAGFRDDFHGLSAARIQLTITNPSLAEHPGGNWDLGNGGSKYFCELSVSINTDAELISKLSAERGHPLQMALNAKLSQESSGGDNWKSETHLDRHRKVAFESKGYKVTHTQGDAEGLRASPIMTTGKYGITMPYFWENFPKRLSLQLRILFLELFPKQSEPHELQGGEHKTHTFTVAFADTGVTAEPLVWARSPLQVSCSPEWYARCEALPHLTPKSTDPHALYLKLVDQAIEGPDTFLHKREKIDEYGWRNFGDIYGDHEAVRHAGPAPLVSHYNNQYDCVGGFAAQFFRSADPRWFSQMIECADHTADIDIYHTTGDKAAYNGGLFWHTYHYAHADTSTHRSYPKRIRSGPQDTRVEKLDSLDDATKQKLLKAYSVGGGPAPSHVYTTGMMIAYFLTGDPRYRQTVVGLADYILNCEDPSKTVFRWLSREYTGLATDSQAGYHGPGRASANSVNALLDGFRLTGDRKYLDFAEKLIRRVVSPKQDLDALNLQNAELRWFYTMFLQALGRYLDCKVERGEFDRMFGNAQLSLLHYAQWMAANERPILDMPDKLQYPTETWAAQDLRKVEVFQYAAKYTGGTARELFLERAAWFFKTSLNKLDAFPTKSLCRPVVLLMNHGYSRNWWLQTQVPTIEPIDAGTFGQWAMFVPQKAKAMKRAKLLALAGMLGFSALVLVVAIVLWG